MPLWKKNIPWGQRNRLTNTVTGLPIQISIVWNKRKSTAFTLSRTCTLLSDSYLPIWQGHWCSWWRIENLQGWCCSLQLSDSYHPIPLKRWCSWWQIEHLQEWCCSLPLTRFLPSNSAKALMFLVTDWASPGMMLQPSTRRPKSREKASNSVMRSIKVWCSSKYSLQRQFWSWKWGKMKAEKNCLLLFFIQRKKHVHYRPE